MYRRVLARKRRRRHCVAIAKTLTMALAVALLLGSIIGGTVAWLISRTDPVVNTFTYGDINIALTETDTHDGDDNPNTNSYKMTPGNTITKDPKVTVLADSEDCWLFIKIEESVNAKFSDFMTYEVAEGWIRLEKDKNGSELSDIVYYRTVDATTEDTDFGVLKDDLVTVKDEVTKADFESLTKETYPTLTFTAYAVQRDGGIESIDTAEEAWALAVGQGN